LISNVGNAWSLCQAQFNRIYFINLLIKNSFKATNTTQEVDWHYNLDWTELRGSTKTGARQTGIAGIERTHSCWSQRSTNQGMDCNNTNTM